MWFPFCLKGSNGAWWAGQCFCMQLSIAWTWSMLVAGMQPSNSIGHYTWWTSWPDGRSYHHVSHQSARTKFQEICHILAKHQQFWRIHVPRDCGWRASQAQKNNDIFAMPPLLVKPWHPKNKPKCLHLFWVASFKRCWLQRKPNLWMADALLVIWLCLWAAKMHQKLWKYGVLLKLPTKDAFLHWFNVLTWKHVLWQQDRALGDLHPTLPSCQWKTS